MTTDEDIRTQIRDYADLLARNPGAVNADVAWKLRQIAGEPDAAVIATAPVKLRDGDELDRAKRRLFSVLIANAHRLDVPFTDKPEVSPWLMVKQAMARLDDAVRLRSNQDGGAS